MQGVPININRSLWRQSAILGFGVAFWIILAFIGRLFLGILTPEELNAVLHENRHDPLSPPSSSFYLSFGLVLGCYGLPWFAGLAWLHQMVHIFVDARRLRTHQSLRYILQALFMVAFLICIVAVHVELVADRPDILRHSVQILELLTHSFYLTAFPVMFWVLSCAYRDGRMHRAFAWSLMLAAFLGWLAEIYFTHPQTPIVRWVFSIVTGGVAITMISAYLLLVSQALPASAEDATPTLNS